MAGYTMVPWYATGFRGDDLERALGEIAPLAMRYGATRYAVYRNREDRYKFNQVSYFSSHVEWMRYWEGPEFIDFRVLNSSRYQVPILYGWWDLTAHGGAPMPVEGEVVASAADAAH